MLSRLALRNLRTDRFGTLCTILGVALGTATVDVVLVLDVNTRTTESRSWSTNPDLPVDFSRTVGLTGFRADGTPTLAESAREETHEDYEVMRSAIRLGSLSAFLVGALIVFFTFAVVVERRKREIALLRSLGALPKQVAGIFLLEALIVGFTGAALGLLLAFPLSYLAARSGVTTTGRATLAWLWFPKKEMLLVSAIGALTAVLGVLRPAIDVARMNVSETLRPRFLEDAARSHRRRSSGVTLITLPFMLLLYVLIRPFFQHLLPSLAFFVLEAGLVCAAFLAMLVLVPELVRRLGAAITRLLPKGPAAPRLLTMRRIEHMGHELAWSVSGVMLVFALLLALHLSTWSLKQEVRDWAARAVRPYAFVYTARGWPVPSDVVRKIPDNAVVARFSGRTPWPNSVYAVSGGDLRELVSTTGDAELMAIAERFGPGKVLVSKMMARRYQLSAGDRLEIDNGTEKRRLEVIAVSDDLGYAPNIGPYRNSKTYALIDAADFGLIERHAPGIGAALVIGDPAIPPEDRQLRHYGPILSELPRRRGVYVDSGAAFELTRVRETNRDFAIFDIILFLTTVLAAVGIANNLVLSAHARRREIALHRVLGMTSDQVRQMFLMEGAAVGLLGGALAVLLGIPLGWASIGALKVVSAFDVGFGVPWYYPLVVWIGALAVSLLSALYPARIAGRTRSAESIHYE